MSIFSFLLKLFSKRNSVTSSFINEQDVIDKTLFYTLLDLNDSAILFFNKHSGYIGANQAFFQIFEFEKIDDFINRYKSIRDIFLFESEEIFTEDDKSWMDYIRTHKKDLHYVTAKAKDGQILKFTVRNRVYKRDKNELYILELNNVTEVEELKAKVDEIEALKTKILSNIGHEFRTPMNAILGFLYLLKKTNLNLTQSEYLKMTNSSARSLMSNIEALLDFSQMQSGRLSLNKVEFCFIDEIKELVSFFVEEGYVKGLHVGFFIDPKIPKTLEGDVHKIKQIINELVSNAIKFTTRGGKIIVEIKLLKKNTNGGCSIGFSVKDNGKGIPINRLSEITEPFTSTDEADQRLKMGLSLSYDLVSLLGGELKIQSEEKVGSIFSFSLDFEYCSGYSYAMIPHKNVKVLLLDEKRIDDANLLTTYLRSFSISATKINILDKELYNDIDALYIIASQSNLTWIDELGRYAKTVPVIFMLDTDETLHARLQDTVNSVITKPLLPANISEHLDKLFLNVNENKLQKNQMKVGTMALVVEDNLINQRLIKILLQEYNINAVTTSNGQEAVDICNHKDFDIVFMDIDMPVKDGVIATKEIKEQLTKTGHAMPIIALTALAMEGDRERLLLAGLDDYLSKPLTRNKLDLILNKYLVEKMV